LLLASLGLFSQWSGNGLVSYYATDVYKRIGITNGDTQLEVRMLEHLNASAFQCSLILSQLNGGLTILALIVSCSCAMMVDKVGRRPYSSPPQPACASPSYGRSAPHTRGETAMKAPAAPSLPSSGSSTSCTPSHGPAYWSPTPSRSSLSRSAPKASC
jgi:hypothetical protein